MLPLEEVRIVKRSLLFGISTGVIVATLVFAMNSRTIGSALATITCATTVPCQEGNNTSAGPGVLGQSASGHGVIGNTRFNSTGPSNGESAVFGQDLSTAGVYDMGVQGISTRGYGVRGRSASNSGVRGDSTNSYGVYGTSTNSWAMYASGGLFGIYAHGNSYGADLESNSTGLLASGNSYGTYTYSSAGTALLAITNGTSVWAINAQSPHGSAAVINGGSRGVDATGGYIGVLARGGSFPLAAFAPSGNAVFYVNNAGDVYYHGALHTIASPGGSVTSYTRATTPAIEETGTAHLAYGTANVYLSASFAREINPRLGYQVFLTPGGDTRGLYVVAKYASGFTVREVQGGRGTFNFDYHVYARNTEPANTPAQAAPVAPAPAQNFKIPQIPQQTRPQ